MRFIVYDCEIKKAILGKKETAIEGIEYCKGWGDHAGMGVSVTGVYDSGENRYRVFCDDNAEELYDLMCAADLLVGFNNFGFDDKLLVASYIGFAKIETPRYDILSEIWRAAGLKPSWGSPTTHGGYGLDDMCFENFDVRKTGHGAMAPVDWQLGKIGRVIDYCLNDIYMTLLLFLSALEGRPLLSPKVKGASLLLRDPRVIALSPESKSQERRFVAQVGSEKKDWDYLAWEDCAIEFKQERDFERDKDGYTVAVLDNDGLIVRCWVYLMEWSGPVSAAINKKDVGGVVRALVECNRVEARPEFKIRELKDVG